MLLIKNFQFFRLKSFYLSPEKILTFFFCNIVRLYYEKTYFIQFLLRICMFAITDIFLDENNLLDINKMLNIGGKMVVY